MLPQPKTKKIPDLFVGLVLNKAKDVVVIASFNENREQCRRDCEQRFPGEPQHVMQMLQDPSTVRERLFQFLSYNGVPEEEHGNIMKLIAEGISNMSKGEVDESEYVD